ncbi:LacI family DNA-binding transcriptional regulator [Nonomuraea gerenzanensis]|uniref:Transcriptional regulator, LacI family n=1 Tax=Nonomuraea gerenzanensis TaxID=93944 RepID=A0A1M4EL07_9ACTN|nr:LacI family DNA-binding transcriptional regulator [Nonomuraea gerenzanensis]UBU11084.1 LacI family DNA-binding transcriptional regulator [Nonomuraea gerenzanensis]SBO99542.1 Transcriptional regulator, LacI family [Nonomuraea gerenzanensis]
MTTPKRRLPVMADVAKEAGVSHQTVSRVLNDHPNVRADTRARVEAAITRLGYRRNLVARALVTKRSRTLGVVSFDTTLYGPASTIYGIEQAARTAGYFVSIVSLKSIDADTVRDAIDYLAEQGVDGVVVVAPQRSAGRALESLPSGLPAVAVEGTHRADVSVVCIDQMEGAKLATRHLLDQGHETVYHVSGPHDWLETEGRLEGWRAALEEAGRPVPEPLAGDWSPRAGYEAGKSLAAMDGVTAVFAANDQMALGVLRALSEKGVRVPQQISVVGFDDIPESEFFSPPLTTVRQDFDVVGRHCIEVLLRQIDLGHAAYERLVVRPSFVVRSSTALIR